jgi:hypothetical protein
MQVCAFTSFFLKKFLHLSCSQPGAYTSVVDSNSLNPETDPDPDPAFQVNPNKKNTAEKNTDKKIAIY